MISYKNSELKLNGKNNCVLEEILEKVRKFTV